MSADAGTALANAQAALDRAGGYTLTVEQSNFVLPQWGGADSGTVQVADGGKTARAVLARTGEVGATYTIALTGNQTFFQRSTCDTAFRIPGGGTDVLRPFLFSATKTLANAADVKWAAGSPNAVVANVSGLGQVTIEIDASTGRPSRITGQNNGKPLVWSFGDWGKSLSVSPPADSLQDRGPGGIPC